MERLLALSRQRSQFVYIQGRRRIGKTELMREVFKGRNAFYFFTGRDTVGEFLQRFSTAVSQDPSCGPYTRLESFDEAIEFIFSRLLPAKDAVILDEFQNFAAINPSSFSRFQMLWDRSGAAGKGMLIACGSMQSLMRDIFEGLKEPLYKRATARLLVDEFTPLTVHALLRTLCGTIEARYFFDLYSVFGGVPFYYALFDAGGLNGKPLRDILSAMVFERSGILYDEGSDIAIEAMGKSNAIFFSLMAAVAAGKTKYNEMLSASGVAPGSMEKYLDQLSGEYGYLRRRMSVFSKKQNTRISRYAFDDNFLSFWFRFVHRNRSMLEIGGGDRLLSLMNEDFLSWQGPVWEKTVIQLLVERNRTGAFGFPFTRIGAHFTQKRDGDIDVVMIDDDKKACAVGECKLNLNACNIPSLVAGLRKNASALPVPVRREYLFSVEPISAKTRDYINKLGDIAALDLRDLLELPGGPPIH